MNVNHAPSATAVSATVVDPTTATTTDPASAAAVLAHTLLNSLSIVRGGTELLARHHEALRPAERRAWYRRIDAHAEHLSDVLERVAQGRLAEALKLSEAGCRTQ